MTYSKVIKKLYTKLLGKAIKQKMTDLKILQNQIAYDYSADDIELLSETTVGQIIKGKRNLSFNASLAFQVSLNYKTTQRIVFPKPRLWITTNRSYYYDDHNRFLFWPNYTKENSSK